MPTPPTARRVARSMRDSGPKPHTSRAAAPHPGAAPLHALARFVKGYFLKGGLLDGAVGWDIAMGNAREVWLKYQLLEKLNREREQK